MTKDANQIAAEAARREGQSSLPTSTTGTPRVGLLQIWGGYRGTRTSPLREYDNVTVQIDGATIIAKDFDGDVVILRLGGGDYAEFLPTRAGE